MHYIYRTGDSAVAECLFTTYINYQGIYDCKCTQ